MQLPKGGMQLILSIIVASVVAVSSAYVTFATKAEVKQMVNDKHSTVIYLLHDISDRLTTIEQRLWERK